MRFTVYLSELMTNTTMAGIYNEIKGVEDELNERYDDVDYIRQVDVTNVRVESVRKSKETDGLDSIIVIFVNETESYTNFKQHSVVRYYQDPETNWIESEYLFDTKAEPRDFYEQVDVFDEYAIAYKENKFTVILFRDHMGEVLPPNWEISAHTQSADIAGYSFY